MSPVVFHSERRLLKQHIFDFLISGQLFWLRELPFRLIEDFLRVLNSQQDLLANQQRNDDFSKCTRNIDFLQDVAADLIRDPQHVFESSGEIYDLFRKACIEFNASVKQAKLKGRVYWPTLVDSGYFELRHAGLATKEAIV